MLVEFLDKSHFEENKMYENNSMGMVHEINGSNKVKRKSFSCHKIKISDCED